MSNRFAARAPVIKQESTVTVDDCAAVVAQAVLQLILRQLLEQLLREEFHDAQRQAVADREVDDA